MLKNDSLKTAIIEKNKNMIYIKKNTAGYWLTDWGL